MSKTKNTLLVFKPSNLEYARDIGSYNSRYHEKYAWMIHKIIDEQAKHQFGFNGFINLRKDLLCKFIGGRYCNPVIVQLINSGIIEVQGTYKPGEYSMGYRLCEKYQQAPIEKVALASRKAANYIRKQTMYRRQQTAHLLKEPVLQQLHFNVTEVAFDYSSAMSYARTLYNEGTITSEQYKACYVMASNIENRELFFIRDDKTGRLYHSIANLPGYLRESLSVDGEPLFQVDIANSQPVLCCKLVDEHQQAHNTAATGERSSLSSKYSTSTSSVSSPSSIPYVCTIEYVPADVTLYRKLTAKGEFYEFLMQELEIPADQREEFKAKFFELIFYGKIRKKPHPYEVKFKSLFPTVHAAVLWYKQRSHKDLPIALQKIESEIVIKRVCGRLVGEFPAGKRPFFITIHDAIVCKERDTALVKSLLETELRDALGFVPTVNVTRFVKQIKKQRSNDQ